MNHPIIMRFKSWYISTDVIGSIHQLISKPTIQQQLKQNLILQTTYQKKMNSNTILILNVTVILGLAYLLASATPIPRAPRQASTSTPIPTDAPTCQDAAPVSNLILSSLNWIVIIIHTYNNQCVAALIIFLSSLQKNCSAKEANIKIMCDAVFYQDLISSSGDYEAMSDYLDTLLVLIMEKVSSCYSIWGVYV